MVAHVDLPVAIEPVRPITRMRGEKARIEFVPYEALCLIECCEVQSQLDVRVRLCVSALVANHRWA